MIQIVKLESHQKKILPEIATRVEKIVRKWCIYGDFLLQL